MDGRYLCSITTHSQLNACDKLLRIVETMLMNDLSVNLQGLQLDERMIKKKIKRGFRK